MHFLLRLKAKYWRVSDAVYFKSKITVLDDNLYGTLHFHACFSDLGCLNFTPFEGH